MKDAPASIESSRNRVDFEGGVHLGIGTFNLVCAMKNVPYFLLLGFPFYLFFLMSIQYCSLGSRILIHS